MKITHKKQDHFNINILQTKKFKTIKFEITFANALTKEHATKRALLPFLLRAITSTYPTRPLLQTKLEEMYSASFSAGVRKVGLSQIIVFDLSIINNKYTFHNEDLFLEGLQFVKDVLFHPKFDKAIFKEEKRLLDEHFKGIYANKMRYAIKETLNSMYEGDPYNVDTYGNEEDLAKLTLEDCIDAYHDMIHNDTINVNIVGDVDINAVNILLNKELHFQDRTNNLVLIDTSFKQDKEHTVLIENQKINQAKLVLAYQFPVYYNTDEYYQAVVLNTLIGGGPESLLFKKVREELSLVYFIGSAYDQNKGSFVIYCGINQNDYKKVVEEVGNILQTVEKKAYNEKFLHIAKKGIISGLLQSFDSAGSLISRLNSLSLFNKELDTEELIAKVNNVTSDDLSKLVTKLKRDTTYLLRNDELEDDTL